MRRMILFCLAFVFLFAGGVFADLSAGKSDEPLSDYQKIFKSQKHKKLVFALKKSGFTDEEIDGIFSDKNFRVYSKKVIGGKFLPFEDYKKIVLSEESIARGAVFISENKDILDLARKKYGVEKKILPRLCALKPILAGFWAITKQLTVYTVFIII